MSHNGKPEHAFEKALKKEVMKTSAKGLEGKKKSKSVIRKNGEDAKFIKRMREHR
jgi:hypothetical protein